MIIIKLKQQITALNFSLDERVKDIAELKDSVTKLKNEDERKAVVIKEQWGENRARINELNALNSERYKLDGEIKELKKWAKVKNEDNARLKKQIREQLEDLNAHKAESESVLEALDSMHRQLDKQKDKNRKLKKFKKLLKLLK